MTASPIPLPVTVAQVNDFIAAELPFCARFGIVCDDLALDESVMRWRHDPAWTRPGSEHRSAAEAFVSGPVMMTLADVGIYVAIFTRAGIVPLALTNELKTNFLRPSSGHDLLCRTRLLKVGRQVAYGAAEIYEDRSPDRVVAHATSSYIMPA